MKNRFLEIHFSSSRGTIANSFKLSSYFIIIISTMLLSIFIFMLISTVLYFSSYSTESQDEINNYIKNKMESNLFLENSNIEFLNPISENHFYVAQGFEDNHKGIDIVAEKGSNIHAASTGKVIHSGYDNIYGKIIVLAHKNNFYTFYGHLDSIFVKKHNFIKNNEIIGLIGDTGETSGPHLHFEIWNEWDVKDPRLLIKELKDRDVTK